MPLPRLALAIPLCLTLAACASGYIAPTGGPQARVRLNVTGDNYFAMMHTFEEQSTCHGDLSIALLGGPGFVKANPQNNPRAGMIGSKSSIDPHIAEIVVPAGKPFTIRYNQIGPHGTMVVRGCSLIATFTPEADGQYELVYSYDGKLCGINTAKLSQTPGSEISRTNIPDFIKRTQGMLGCE